MITENTLQFEIVPAELGLELSAKNSLELAFSGFFATAAEWKDKAETITDPKEARTARLEIKNLRIAVEKKHKEMKADSLLFSRAVDGAKNIFLALATPIERQLDDIEKAEERREAARIEALRYDRAGILADLNYQHFGSNLGMMGDDEWITYHQQAIDTNTTRIEREKKAREEAEAAAKKEAEEREAQRIENIRLREEADKAAAALAKERAERSKRDAAAKAERDAAEAKAREEVLKANEAAEKARLKAAAELAKDQAAKAKVYAEAKALRDAEAKRIENERHNAYTMALAEAAALKKAAAAPDKAKLQEFAHIVRALTVPEVKRNESKAVRDEIIKKVAGFADWIETQASTL